MPELRIMMGLPASGKSTYCSDLMDHGYVIVNPDKIRLALHGQAFQKLAEGFVWATAELMVRTLLMQGHSVVVDATNMHKQARSRWRSIAGEFGLKLYIDWHKASVETCKARDAARASGRVGPEVIDRMAISLQEPTDKEGIVTLFLEVK